MYVARIHRIAHNMARYSEERKAKQRSRAATLVTFETPQAKSYMCMNSPCLVCQRMGIMPLMPHTHTHL